MPEVTVKILQRNNRNGSRFESLVELFLGGEPMINGIIVSWVKPLNDTQIENLALSKVYPDIYIPVEYMTTDSKEVKE